jgi:tol-pal system protein YbgF
MNQQLATEYYNNGLQYAKEEKWDEALELLNSAIAEDPKHVNSYNVLGKVYIQKGELKAARRCWRMALRIDPDNVTAKQCLATAGKRSVRIRFRALLWPAVVVILLAALIITNSMLLRRISNLETELAKATAVKTQDSRLKTQDTKDQQTESVKPDTGYSLQESSIQHPASSIQRPTKLPELETASEVTGVYNRARAAYESKRYDQAIEMFQQILKYPSPHELKHNAQFWLGQCYYKQKDYVRALDEYQKVKKNFPKGNKVFDAELKIAYTYYELGRIEEAKQNLSQLSKDWPHQQYRSRIAVLSKEISSNQ